MSTETTDSTVGPGVPVARGEVVADKYVVAGQLGRGGMGVVVEARDKLLGRRVAIKFLLPELSHSKRAVQRFIREARVATRITSEHVVRLLEIDTLPNGMPFFVMEYLDGQDLKAVLAERGPLPVSVVADYVLQALEAIAEGHRLGVVHRDIKPSNLFVTKHADGRPLVKVLDFGIAKAPDLDDAQPSDLTGSEETRLGSLPYTSPEQFQSPSKVDARSDIWALGVTLYELVCGKHPCVSKAASDLTLWLVSGGEPEPPSRRRRDLALPRGFDELVLRCLSRDRDGRFASVAELAAALAPFASEEARASLRVIRGLSEPARSGEGPDSTLPVVDSRGPRTRGAARQPRSTKLFLGAGALALGLIGLAASGLLSARKPAPPALPAAVPATAPLAPSELPATAPLGPSEPLATASQAVATARAPLAPEPSASSPPRTRELSVAKPEGLTSAPRPSSGIARALPRASSAPSAEPKAAAEAPSQPNAEPAPGLPRNQRIELNIATRR